MEEKDIVEISTDVIESLTKLSMGEQPHLLSNRVFKSLAEHANFIIIKKLYADFLLNDFNGQYSDSESLKKLTELRYKLAELYDI